MALDVVIVQEGSSWTDTVVPALIGLIGVLVGATLAAVFELWRKATEGKSAARLVRMELIEYGVSVEKLAFGRPSAALPVASAWPQYRLTIASFLPELRLARMSELYSRLQPITVLMKEIYPNLYGLQTDEAKLLAKDWLDRSRQIRPSLRGIEGSSTIRLMTILLRGQAPATPDEIRKEWGLDEEGVPQEA